MIFTIVLIFACTKNKSPIEPNKPGKIPSAIDIWKTLSQMEVGKPPPHDLAELIGKRIKVAGYMILNDADNSETTKEFLITPVPGGCVHVPRPPPNYIIHVTANKPLNSSELSFDPVEVIGALTVPKKLDDRKFYAFEIIAESVEAFDYATR